MLFIVTDEILTHLETYENEVMGDRGGKSRFRLPMSSWRPYTNKVLPNSLESIPAVEVSVIVVDTLVV